MVPSLFGNAGGRGQSSGARHVRHARPLAGDLELAAAERGVDGEDLLVADVADGARLGDVAAGDRHDDVEIEHRRPCARTTDTAPSPTPAAGRWSPPSPSPPPPARSRRTGSRSRTRQLALDRQIPAVRVVRRLQAEEFPRVHGSRCSRPRFHGTIRAGRSRGTLCPQATRQRRRVGWGAACRVAAPHLPGGAAHRRRPRGARGADSVRAAATASASRAPHSERRPRPSRRGPSRRYSTGSRARQPLEWRACGCGWSRGGCCSSPRRRRRWTARSIRRGIACSAA